MSKGHDKTNGGKGNNFSFQFNLLRVMEQIRQAIIAGGGGGGATEATLLNVLSAIQSEQDFEQNLVIDQGGVGTPTYLMVRIYNEVTHTFDPPQYFDATGTPVVPVGPVELVNPQYVLTNILGQLDVALSTRASEATLAGIKTKTDLLNFIATALEVTVSSSALPTGAATEATLSAIQTLVNTANTILTSIQGDTANLDVALSTRASEATLSTLNGLVATAANQATEIARLTSILGQLDVALSTRNAEATQLAIQALLTTIDGDTSNLDVALSTRATEATLATASATLTSILGQLDVALSTRASEATLAAAKTDLDTLATPVTGLAIDVVRDTAAGNVAAGKRSIAVFNAGAADGTVAGVTIKPGESFTFDAGSLRDTLAALAYDGSGTELVITTVG